MSHPKRKTFAEFTIEVDPQGYPRWTRVSNKNGDWVMTLNEEEARDLHYALSRIVEYLDDAKRVDISRGILP